jgi:hypothetical protein
MIFNRIVEVVVGAPDQMTGNQNKNGCTFCTQQQQSTSIEAKCT